VLIHIVDATAGMEAALDALRAVTSELDAFSATLAAKPTLVALNKVDVPEGLSTVGELRAGPLPDAFAIAAATGEGTRELLRAAAALVWEERAREAAARAVAPPAEAPQRVYQQRRRGLGEFGVERDGEMYVVRGREVERAVAMTDLGNEDAVAHLQRRLRQAGVDEALRRAGATEGDTVRIGAAEFDWSDEDSPQ
jgi:GTP-binding protein